MACGQRAALEPGATAMELLEEIGDRHRHVVVEPEPVIRASTA